MELNRNNSVLRKIMPKRLWDFLHDRLLRFFEPDFYQQKPYINLSFSQEGEDLILQRLVEGKTNGFYVDVGAHHPFRFSNTYKFYLQGWRGINMDPLPGCMDLFDTLRPHDINLEIAISSQNAEQLYYYMFSEPAFNTFIKEKADWLVENSKAQLIERKQIQTTTFKEVCQKHLPKGQAIDILSIDVEGMDLTVLESNDWDLYRPKYLVVESFMQGLEDHQRSPLHTFLSNNGYLMVSKAVHSFIYMDSKNTLK
jgi:FkbM family methyltransferase